MVLWALLFGTVVAAVGVAAALERLACRLWAPGHSADGIEWLRDGRTRLVERLAPAPAAALVLVAGVALMLLLASIAGEALAVLEPSVDVPVFDWLVSRTADAPAILDVSKALTRMGDPVVIQITVVVLGVLLGLVYRRSFWVPPLFIIGAYVVERYAQSNLASIVDRGHPVTSPGTYPSGGMARLIVVWGVALVLAGRRFDAVRRRRPLLLALLCVAVAVEGYTRTVLLKHWVTDVVGGVFFGVLLLGAVLASLWTLDPAVDSARSPRTGLRQDRREPRD